jgi:hypothetical protein
VVEELVLGRVVPEGLGVGSRAARVWLAKRAVVLEELQTLGVRAEVDMVGEVTERLEFHLPVVLVVQVITEEEVVVEVGMGAVEVAGIAI